jgi:hypothetical protein
MRVIDFETDGLGHIGNCYGNGVYLRGENGSVSGRIMRSENEGFLDIHIALLDKDSMFRFDIELPLWLQDYVVEEQHTHERKEILADHVCRHTAGWLGGKLYVMYQHDTLNGGELHIWGKKTEESSAWWQASIQQCRNIQLEATHLEAGHFEEDGNEDGNEDGDEAADILRTAE